jgi:hypothetical protein
MRVDLAVGRVKARNNARATTGWKHLTRMRVRALLRPGSDMGRRAQVGTRSCRSLDKRRPRRFNPPAN